MDARTPQTETLDFDVKGMTCASCVAHVEKALTQTPGVTAARINLATERAEVDLGPGADPAKIASAVTEAGYEIGRAHV